MTLEHKSSHFRQTLSLEIDHLAVIYLGIHECVEVVILINIHLMLIL